MEFIRTDKNGTQYFRDVHEETCPRCSGRGLYATGVENGRLRITSIDNGVCYQCLGTGKITIDKIVKVYLPEYQAKLDAKKAEREAKKLEESNSDEKQAELAKKNLEAKIATMKYYGFNEKGEAFLLTGNTYQYKEEIKERGGKWNSFLKGWICPDFFVQKGIDYKLVHFDELKGTAF